MRPRQTLSILAALLAALAGLAPRAARSARAQAPKPPNIVFLLADDLGWSDVGYHESEIRTPNIDRLAASGTKLEQFYVLPVCSPTRGSLMTGRYPMRYGLQTGVVRPWAQYGLPLEERTLAQALKEAGYETAIAGKWHLGHVRRAYLPTRRGFDHQYGHYNGALDYFDHTRDGGFDWHRDDQVCRDEGYTTELLGREAVRLIEQHNPAKPLFLYVPFNAPHAPLQGKPEYLEKYAAIQNPKRRAYAAMVTCEDDQIGKIVAALEKRGMTGDTLVIFSSDNGGPIQQAATNGPLRAGKGTLYEGGVRVPAFAVWPGKIAAGATCSEPLQMVDWYPTLVNLARGSLRQPLPLDGRDLWPTLTQGKPTPHDSLLLNVEADRGAVRQGPWKLVYTGKLPRPEGTVEKAELFNLADDPNEKTDLAAAQSERVAQLLKLLDRYAREAVPAKGGDENAPAPPGWRGPAVYGEVD